MVLMVALVMVVGVIIYRAGDFMEMVMTTIVVMMRLLSI